MNTWIQALELCGAVVSVINMSLLLFHMNRGRNETNTLLEMIRWHDREIGRLDVGLRDVMLQVNKNTEHLENMYKDVVKMSNANTNLILKAFQDGEDKIFKHIDGLVRDANAVRLTHETRIRRLEDGLGERTE